MKLNNYNIKELKNNNLRIKVDEMFYGWDSLEIQYFQSEKTEDIKMIDDLIQRIVNKELETIDDILCSYPDLYEKGLLILNRLEDVDTVMTPEQNEGEATFELIVFNSKENEIIFSNEDDTLKEEAFRYVYVLPADVITEFFSENMIDNILEYIDDVQEYTIPQFQELMNNSQGSIESNSFFYFSKNKLIK